jgi:hypothetical protein
MKSSSSSRALSCAALLLLALLPALSGCASTKVREVWRDEAYGGHPKSVLVVAVMKNLTVQRQFESEFAKRLKERGIKAVESFRVLPDGVALEGDAGREAVVAAIKEQGIDAVLLTRVTGRRTQKEEIPGMTITAGYGYPYAGAGAWGGYAGVGYTFGGPSKPTTQGYSHETMFLDIETHLFDAKAEKLIWGARSETRVAGPPQEQIVPYVENVCRILLHEPFLR